jgi:hypothetical protein
MICSVAGEKITYNVQGIAAVKAMTAPMLNRIIATFIIFRLYCYNAMLAVRAGQKQKNG